MPVGLPVALVLLVAPAGLQAQGSGAGAGAVVVATLAEVIHPISAEFIVDAVADAERRNAELLILRLNTPGGLDSSMRTIVQAMLGSRVPICLFVGPSGARAASAGFFMAMAADVVAMAPGTNMGAASPVPIGGGTVDETMANKLMQDAEAYMRSLAEQHGRPADLAAEAVADGRSFRASEALESGLADLVVDDIGDLLSALDGWVLQRREGEVTLNLASSERIELELSLRQRILAILANPRVAYMLMLIGLGGIYFELSTPGAVLPGVLGAISLVLALLAFQVLPISFAGLALILLALVFFVIEIKVTSYGLLTVAGLVSFVLGSLMLVTRAHSRDAAGLGVRSPCRNRRRWPGGISTVAGSRRSPRAGADGHCGPRARARRSAHRVRPRRARQRVRARRALASAVGFFGSSRRHCGGAGCFRGHGGRGARVTRLDARLKQRALFPGRPIDFRSSTDRQE